VGNTIIEHVDFSTQYRQFKNPNIFKTKHSQSYKNKNLFLLVRSPVNRLLSEFNFRYPILDGKMSLSFKLETICLIFLRKKNLIKLMN
jgi:hypothetical protein